MSTVFYNMNKLVVNDELGPFHVSAIGQDLWPNQSSLYYNNLFVDIPDITTTGYDVYYFDYNEHYYDLLLTDKFIVCCGYDTDPSVQSICYRKTERFNISTCPLFDSIHYFAGGDDAYSMTHSTSLDTNRIAMSYFYMSGPTSYTRIRTIDVMYSIMTNSYEFVLPDKGEPKHLAFIPANRNLVVMQDFAYAGTYNSNFIQFNPFINYPPGIIEYKPAKIFQHLTEHYFKYYLASLGSEWFWKEGSAAPTGYPDADCPDENIMEIKETQTLRHHVIYNNITPVSNTGNIVPMPHDDNLYRVSIECTNQ